MYFNVGEGKQTRTLKFYDEYMENYWNFLGKTLQEISWFKILIAEMKTFYQIELKFSPLTS